MTILHKNPETPGKDKNLYITGIQERELHEKVIENVFSKIIEGNRYKRHIRHKTARAGKKLLASHYS